MKKGDKIKFKVVTRSGTTTATRIINGFWDLEKTVPTVRFEGWTAFAVNRSEILEHIEV